MYEEALKRIREICSVLPAVSERLSHGQPTFFVKEKRSFIMVTNDHHGDGRLAVWCAAPAHVQGQLRDTAPEWFFVPPYVGPRGWIGVRLDRGLDWETVTEYVKEAYCAVAPPALVAQLDTSATLTE
jgi:hypothetical protein